MYILLELRSILDLGVLDDLEGTVAIVEGDELSESLQGMTSAIVGRGHNGGSGVLPCRLKWL